MQADVVFDCRGLRPNNRDSFGGGAEEKKAQSKLGLPLESIAPSGWLRVDPKFRLAARNPDGPVATEENPAAGLEPVYNGRVYCVGDAAEKDKNERTAANAHAEGEYAALDILRRTEGRSPRQSRVVFDESPTAARSNAAAPSGHSPKSSFRNKPPEPELKVDNAADAVLPRLGAAPPSPSGSIPFTRDEDGEE